MKLIHYWSSSFDPNKRVPIKNSTKCLGVKPDGGLWTSPIGSEYGRRDRCKDEDFNVSTLDYYFTLDVDSSRLLKIDSEQDMFMLPRKEIPDYPLSTVIDFERLAAIDSLVGIWLTVKGERETRFPMNRANSMYWRDCETVLLFRKPKLLKTSLGLDLLEKTLICI